MNWAKVFRYILIAAITFPTFDGIGSDTSIATFQLSAFIPSSISATPIQSGQTDISLGGGSGTGLGGGTGSGIGGFGGGGTTALVNVLHFRYNVPIAEISVASDTLTGQPEDENGRPFNLQGVSLNFKFVSGCKSVDSTYAAPFALKSSGTDVKSTVAANPTEAIDEECPLYATWVGSSKKQPLAGRYTMNLRIVIVSL